MRSVFRTVTLVLVAFAVLQALEALAAEKLPKCSMKYCRATGCSATELCASGAHVKTCADICNGN